MFQMSIRASSATRLLVAVGVAWLGLALSAQAAHATYSRVQVVKINQGGDPNDVFTFDTSLKPAASPASFGLKGARAAASTASSATSAAAAPRSGATRSRPSRSARPPATR